jgi:hypothetical protein
MIRIVGFEVLTAVSTKTTVFWVVVPCSLVEVYQRYRGAADSIIRVITLMMLAARTSETLANFYQTTRCYNPEDSHLYEGSKPLGRLGTDRRKKNIKM